MSAQALMRSTVRWFAAGVGLVAGAYATYVGITWCRYGHVRLPATPEEQDRLLDQFMPTYEVVERHSIRVAAPASITLAAAQAMDLNQSRVVRAIFKGRELILGATADDRRRPRGLLEDMKSLGWGVLAEAPGREIVVGAVTRPWEPNVTFRALPPHEFAGSREPGYVKIAWTLRSDPTSANESIFRTETRAVATDAISRAKFRQYWAFFSPGIVLIRWLTAEPLKKQAERDALTARRITLPAH